MLIRLTHRNCTPLPTRVTEDLEEQSNVKGVLLSHYVTLVEVFKHYASVGSAQSTGEIDVMEASNKIRRKHQRATGRPHEHRSRR